MDVAPKHPVLKRYTCGCVYSPAQPTITSPVWGSNADKYVTNEWLSLGSAVNGNVIHIPQICPFCARSQGTGVRDRRVGKPFG
jgi:hypothetical protein